MAQFRVTLGEARILKPAAMQGFSDLDSGQAAVIINCAQRNGMFTIAFAVEETPSPDPLRTYMRVSFDPGFLRRLRTAIMGEVLGPDGESYIVPD